MDSSSRRPVVIDNGSGVIKAGFAEADEPELIFHSYVGKPKHKKIMASGLSGDLFIGPRVDTYRGLLNVKRPITHGVITDFGSQELIWQYIFKSLHVSSEEQPLLITEPVLNPYKNREEMAEKLFEGFHVPNLCISTPAILCMYSASKTTGLVVDVGDGVTSCVPIVEGFALRGAIAKTDLAGRDVTDYLATLLMKTGANFCSSTEKEIVREIKEKACYVALDPSEEEDIAKTTFNNRKDPRSPWGVYKLPDGALVDIGPERFRAPEVLFNPGIVGNESPSLPEMVVGSIARTEVDLRNSLYENIILAGGTTATKGFGKRLFTEVKALAPKDTKIKMVAPPDRAFSAWVGGSLLASLSTFKTMWVSKEEYDNYGSSCLHRKFF